MAFKNQMASIARDIAHQSNRLILFQELEAVFSPIRMDGIQVYACQYSDGETYVSFSPEYNSDNKDIRPFIHAICRKFHVKLAKTRSYDKTAIEYKGEFIHDGKKFRIEIAGVVPKTCHLEEKVTELTEDEFEEAQREALESVSRVKIEKTLVCK